MLQGANHTETAPARIMLPATTNTWLTQLITITPSPKTKEEMDAEVFISPPDHIQGQEQNFQGQRQEVAHGDMPEARAQKEHQAEP